MYAAFTGNIAKGNFIFILDNDDAMLFLQDCLIKLVESMELQYVDLHLHLDQLL